ncbi:iron-sulfur cluster repair di-iron protein [Geothrix terrae]|uniref:iron-sulfur cluster repair di-iron protein n=1 Tax=Geothrix terrae TaxID=2922720 RepID=UPI001FACB79D|nr:iron-sulfur cluster repair di-iron protein [Geothrix terrae]
MSQEWENRSVGELVLEKPSRSKVFEKVGLDYCCKGQDALGKACQQKGIALEGVVAALQEMEAKAPEDEDRSWMMDLPTAVEHVLRVHHDYTKEALPRLLFLTGKVAKVHGDEDPRLIELDRAFQAFAQETFDHLAKEEQMLFPMFLALAKGQRWPAPPTVQMPIARMLEEHLQHGENLELFRHLTDGFVPPPGACNSWRALLDGLAELEYDLHRHIHKENSWLYPTAIELEAKL